jgi:hypothetical protein
MTETAVQYLKRMVFPYLTHEQKLLTGQFFVQAEEIQNKQYTRDEVHMLMCLAFEQGFKKADVVNAGLEGKETDVECAWILTKYDSEPNKEIYGK